MDIIRLITCLDSIEAYQIKNKLEDDGISCFLTNENFTSLFPNYFGILGSGVQVMIEEKDLYRALSIVNSDKLDSTIVKCPNCKSEKIDYTMGNNPLKKILVIFLSLLIWIPFGNIKKSYVCKDCGARFKS